MYVLVKMMGLLGTHIYNFKAHQAFQWLMGAVNIMFQVETIKSFNLRMHCVLHNSRPSNSP